MGKLTIEVVVAIPVESLIHDPQHLPHLRGYPFNGEQVNQSEHLFVVICSRGGKKKRERREKAKGNEEGNERRQTEKREGKGKGRRKREKAKREGKERRQREKAKREGRRQREK